MKMIKTFFRHFFSRELIKFAFVGLVNTIIHMSILFALVNYFEIYYIFSSFLAFLAAVTNSFVFNTIWTFKENIKHKTGSRYAKFFTVSSISAVLNLLFLYIFTEFFGIWYMISQAITIAITLMINFLGNKMWSYR